MATKDKATRAQRYKKAKRTSFGPENASTLLFDRFGVLVKHQNGSRVTDRTIDYVSRCCQTFSAALEYLGYPGMRQALLPLGGLVVSHTLGKHPFMNSMSGVFHNNERDGWPPAVSVGLRGDESTVHELAHAVDYSLGRQLNDPNAQGKKRYLSTELRREDLAKMISTCNHRDLDLRPTTLRDLFRTSRASHAFQSGNDGYWSLPCEQFARAFEQVTAYLVHRDGTVPVGVNDYARLRREKGQWDVPPEPAELDVICGPLRELIERHGSGKNRKS